MCAVCVESDQSLRWSFEDLYRAYEECRRRKRATINALTFEQDLLQNLRSLEEELADGSYQPARSVCFVTRQPKLREIFAADFRDRVVHHLLVSRLEAIFEPKFIHDSYACRRNKGTHAAVFRLREFMNSASLGGKRAVWFMQLDVRSFFMSIDKPILATILERHVKAPELLALSRTIIDHDCTENFVFKGDCGLLSQIPPHKSLFRTPPGRGLPIGNLTSQFFANVYLNELDQFVKHSLKCRWYLRYVDDFILLHESRTALLDMKGLIEQFLHEKLALELKPDFTLKRVSAGADFLGYIVRPSYVLARKRVVGNMRAKLGEYEKTLFPSPRSSPRRGEEEKERSPGKAAGCQASRVIYRLNEEVVQNVRKTLSSYLGHFKHANTRRLVRGLFQKYHCLQAVFRIEYHGADYKLVQLTTPRTVPQSLQEQYYWFARRYPDRCLLFQVGRFYELYGEQAKQYCGMLRLATAPERRRMGVQCGFPLRMLAQYIRMCLNRGTNYAVVDEQGYYPSGLKKRSVVELGTTAREVL